MFQGQSVETSHFNPHVFVLLSYPNSNVYIEGD